MAAWRIVWTAACCLGLWLQAAQCQGAAAVLDQLQADVRQALAAIKPSVASVKAQKRQMLKGGGEMWFESVGSGLVVDERGYILTNSHVVRSGERVTVALWNGSGTELPATIVDEDVDNDLALLKIEPAAALRPAPLGDAAGLAVGDWVVSVGSPYGYEHSATFGIVSGLHRNLMINGVAYRDMIQTDAAITQGNSGGPLLDLNGVAVGINAAIFSPENAYTGIAFTIPINRAKHFISRTIGAVPTIRSAPAGTPAATGTPVAAGTPTAVGPQGGLRPGFQPLPDQPAPAAAVNPVRPQPGAALPAQALPNPGPAGQPLTIAGQPAQPLPAVGQPAAVPPDALPVGQPLPTAAQPVQGLPVQTQGAAGANPAGQPPFAGIPPRQPGAAPQAPPAGGAVAASPGQSALQPGFMPLPATVMTAPAVAGALQTAAAAAPALPPPPNPKEPVDLNKTPPNDATHKTFSDCTTCHVITKKLVVNMQSTMPHPPLGNCDTCHVMINEKPVAGPTTVAWNTIVARIPGLKSLGGAPYVTYAAVLLAALLATAIGFDAGLLFVPILLFHGLGLEMACAASLLMLAVVGLPAMVRFDGSDCIDLRLFAVVLPPAALGAFGGAFGAAFLDPTYLPMGLAACLLLAAMLFSRNPALESVWGGRRDRGGLAWRPVYGGEPYVLGLASLSACVLVAAGLGGLLGASGSWLLLPMVMTVFRIPLPVAAAVAAVMTPVVGLFGYLGHAVVGQYDVPMLVQLCAAALVGSMGGLLLQSLKTNTRARACGVMASAMAACAVILRIANLI
ncbi:S1C family serine protease [Solidesulfovibrio magneticus]|uniref:Probable membrane transporter protein n=1 Tax=Solidesulfovibrio magneticus (strain ATCC 700980 / DSM 13731 / RS-1) TaxID=573370 RepID=C4XPP9_SOLM1|nr:TSUP family transporter [Solidesulfovibrio magneticus]BAH77599.1 putative magnetosome protein MamE [Solidesulfovibrio magneticus RS-1]